MHPLKLLLLTFLAASSISAAPTTCANIYFANTAPDIINIKLTKATKELCFKEFVVMHSGVSKTPLWSAEHLTRTMLNGKAVRSNEFHAEERLTHEERAELNDYAHSGYDRGHMSNSADHIEPQANYETFTLANMVPQDHNNNAGLWSHIEGATRYLAKKDNDIYVVTGPIFIGNNLKRIGGRVLVPTKLFKAIYVPSSGQGAAYLTDNAPGEDYKVISISELEKMTGIDIFPKMTQSAKEHAMELPIPKGNQHSSYDHSSSQNNNSDNGFFGKLERKVHNFNKGY